MHFVQVHRPLWKMTQLRSVHYEDSDIVEPPDDRPESLPLYVPWLSASPPREEGEEEDGEDEEVL